MKKIIRGIYEWSKMILFALIVAFWLKNNVVASALVPTGSMEGTVMTGSRIVINRLAYLHDNPQRGDIVSFYYPDDGETLYLKRIIGLPGETVEIKDGRIYIDNKLLDYNKDMEDIVNPGLAASPITLSYNEYFVIGDNWNSSEDSRSGTVENVKTEEITGKVWLVVSPFVRIGLVN